MCSPKCWRCFLELGKVCWSSLVHNALQMSPKPNQSLQSYEPTCRRNFTAGRNLIVAPKHSLCSYHTVTISVIRTHGNCTLRTAPLQLNVRYYSTVWRFPPHLLYIYRAANINFKFSRFSAPPCTNKISWSRVYDPLRSRDRSYKGTAWV
jgi:hypothetical protein